MRKLGLIILVFSMPAVLAQHTPRSTSLRAYPIVQTPARDRASSSLIMEEMPLIAPLFIEDSGLSSELVTVNNSSDPAGATLSIHSLEGAEIVNFHLILKPHEDRHFSVASFTSGPGFRPRYGSISVLPDKNLKGPSIAGQLLITDTSHTTPAYLDEELAMPDMQGSSILRGVTDEASGEPLLAVSNLSSQSQEVTIHCVGTEAKQTTKLLTMAPLATSLTRACSGSCITDLPHFLSEPSTDIHGVTGIEVIGEGGPGEIAAFAFAPHKRSSETIFSSVPFSDPAMIHSTDVIFAGVPIGPQPTLPDGLYIPRVSLSNFSAQPAHVIVSLAVTARSRLESSDGSSSVRPPHVFSTVTIPPRQSREIVFSGSESQSGLLNSLYVKSDLQPGELQGKVVSRSNGGLFEIELLGKDVLDLNNGGIHPWTSEGDAESHLILYNHSQTAQKFDVAIFNGKTLWDKTYHLVPSETIEISFNQLMSDKVADDKGTYLDPSLKKGVVNWMTPDSGNATGRLMVTSRSALMARNYSCGNFVIPCGGSFQQISDFIGVGQAIALFGISNIQFCNSYNPGQCYGNNQGSGSASYSSSTTAPSIIAFNTFGDQYSQSPVMLGMTSGSSTFYETASANGCQVGGSGGANTQVPTYFFASSAVNVQGGCYSPSVGSFYNVSYTVEDQNSTPIAIAGMTPLEKSVGMTQYGSFALPSTTSSSGSFNDDPVGSCFTFKAGTPAGTQACNPTFTVTYQDTLGTITSPISTSTVRTDCALGQTLQIQGNTPQSQNQTFTQGRAN